MNIAIQKAINLVGGQHKLAELAGVTQPAISYLLRGRTPRYETAVRLSRAVNGAIAWQDFMEGKQGTTEQESQDGSTDASSNFTQATACPRSTVSSASSQGTDTHGGDSPLVGG